MPPDIDLPRDFMPPPVMRRLGVKILRAAKGEAEVMATVGGEYGNHDGTLQTGLIMSVMDVATILAVYSATHDMGTTMLDASIQVLRPVQPGTLTARGRLLRAGRRVSYAEAELLSDGEVSAVARTTWLSGRRPGDPPGT
ncbi:MAG: PaaI family thioesterase [Thermoplasmatota archaeon]